MTHLPTRKRDARKVTRELEGLFRPRGAVPLTPQAMTRRAGEARISCVLSAQARARGGGGGTPYRPNGIRLLTSGGGRWDPEFVRAKRMVQQWHAEHGGYWVPRGTRTAWRARKGTVDHLPRRDTPLKRRALTAQTPTVWWRSDRRLVVASNDRLALEVADVLEAAHTEARAHRRSRTPRKDLFATKTGIRGHLCLTSFLEAGEMSPKRQMVGD